MITISIQAGGKSSRMGRDKALVKLDGRPLIEHVLARVQGLGDEILITTNNPSELEYLGCRLVSDRNPGAGALYGLETALMSAAGQSVLLLACDAPFVSRPLLEHLVRQRRHADVVIPEKAGRFEPLQALYDRKTCLPAVQDAIRSGKNRMISFFSEVEVCPIDERKIATLDPAGVSFFNINTEADLRKAEEMLRDMRDTTP